MCDQLSSENNTLLQFFFSSSLDVMDEILGKGAG